MRALIIVALFFGAVLAYRAGQRGHAFSQARSDVRDARGKLGKARTARRGAARSAVAGWAVLAGGVLLVVLVLAAANR